MQRKYKKTNKNTRENRKQRKLFNMEDYKNLEFQKLDLQQQHHNCKNHKRTLLFSHKEMLLVFILIGLAGIPKTGCDDTENFQKNSKYLEEIRYNI